MRNLAMALAIGALVFAALFVPSFLKLGEALVPAVITAVIAYIFFARRTYRQLEGVFSEGMQALQSMPPRPDLAIATMEKAYKLTSQQFGLRSQVDTQIGVIYFVQQEFNKALPYLKRSTMFGHWMGGAMLAVIYYKKKDHVEMRKTMDVVTRRAKKQGLAWNLYAYLLVQIGDTTAAQKALAEGTKHVKDDPRVQDSLLALQNGKKLKMRAYKDQWYQFHLERPPTDYQQKGVPGGRMGKIARRGRW